MQARCCTKRGRWPRATRRPSCWPRARCCPSLRARLWRRASPLSRDMTSSRGSPPSCTAPTPARGRSGVWGRRLRGARGPRGQRCRSKGTVGPAATGAREPLAPAAGRGTWIAGPAAAGQAEGTVNAGFAVQSLAGDGQAWERGGGAAGGWTVAVWARAEPACAPPRPGALPSPGPPATRCPPRLRSTLPTAGPHQIHPPPVPPQPRPQPQPPCPVPCRPQAGECVLLGSPQELADRCSADPQCKAFVMSLPGGCGGGGGLAGWAGGGWGDGGVAACTKSAAGRPLF